LAVVTDGVEAMAYLRREGVYTEAKRPDLILLDLNLPQKDGREVLREMEADPALRTIPVVVITGSEEERDIGRVYELNAACYVTKPVGLDQFLTVVRCIPSLWLSVVKLPPVDLGAWHSLGKPSSAGPH
jgi:CheY-like chemotaxis protein